MSENKVVKSSEETCDATPQKSDWQTDTKILMSIYVYACFRTETGFLLHSSARWNYYFLG